MSIINSIINLKKKIKQKKNIKESLNKLKVKKSKTITGLGLNYNSKKKNLLEKIIKINNNIEHKINSISLNNLDIKNNSSQNNSSVISENSTSSNNSNRKNIYEKYYISYIKNESYLKYNIQISDFFLNKQFTNFLISLSHYLDTINLDKYITESSDISKGCNKKCSELKILTVFIIEKLITNDFYIIITKFAKILFENLKKHISIISSLKIIGV